MAFEADFPEDRGPFTRRVLNARRQDAALRRSASPQWPAASQDALDEQGQAVVEAVLTFAELQNQSGEAAQPRGMGRQMALSALLLERETPGIDRNLARVVEVYRRARATTPAALRKHASEARAILQYGAVDGRSLPKWVQTLAGETDDQIVAIDGVLAGLNAREILETRARRLSGQRGGRPSAEAFRVLTAVARLKEVARGGDAKAEAELRLVRTFLLDE